MPTINYAGEVRWIAKQSQTQMPGLGGQYQMVLLLKGLFNPY